MSMEGLSPFYARIRVLTLLRRQMGALAAKGLKKDLAVFVNHNCPRLICGYKRVKCDVC